MTLLDSFEKAQCVAGIATNSLFLYLVRRHTRPSLGTYKQLLTVFASFDLFLTLLHLAIEPSIPSFYCSCFCIPFVLMNIHFLHRYWSVSRPHLIALFSRTIFILSLVVISTGSGVTWFLFCMYVLTGKTYDSAVQVLSDAFEHKYGKSMTEGWLVMDHWRDGFEHPRLIVALIVFDIVIFVSIVTAVTLGTLTYIGIRRAQKISKSTANIQFTLLVAVTAQTLVPFLFVYVPYFACLNFPLLGIPAATMVGIGTFLTSCFPAWDAVIVILLMTDYRHAVMRMTSVLAPPLPPSVTHVTSSRVQ